MNIFSRFNKPAVVASVEVAPVVAGPVVAPVATTSIFTKAKAFFAKKTPDALDPKHTPYLSKMIAAMPGVKGALSVSVFGTAEKEAATTILRFHHDLNNLPTGKAVESETFKKFKLLVAPSQIKALLVKGRSSIFASKEGGKAHAEKALNLQLLEAMQEGVKKALQGISVTSKDKQEVLEQFVKTLETQLATDPSSVDQISEEIEKISKDPVLGEEATKGPVSKKLAALKSKIAKIKAETESKKVAGEKDALVQSIIDTQRKQAERFAELAPLFAKLKALKNNADSSVEEGSKVSEEIQTITNSIVEIVSEIDEDSQISPAHIENPMSTNITKARQSELETLLKYDLQKAELKVVEKAQEINKDLVTKLVDLQRTRTMGQYMYDGIFNRNSPVNITLAKDVADQKRIAFLKKDIAKFEAAVKAASAKGFFQRAVDMVKSFTPRAYSVVLQERLTAATTALDECLKDATVQGVLDTRNALAAALSKAESARYIFTSKKKAVEKARSALDSCVAANIATFDKLDGLVKAKSEAETEFGEAVAKEATDADEFPMFA